MEPEVSYRVVDQGGGMNFPSKGLRVDRFGWLRVLKETVWVLFLSLG